MIGRTGNESRDSVAMIVQIARMYHEQNMTQPAIAEQLRISQSRVSRWLKQAVEMGIVRTVVLPPEGVHPELEEQLVRRYGLRQALVVESSGDERSTMWALGAAAATYLEATLANGARVGFSSWSETLLATVDSMVPLKHRRAESIVQIMGGVGQPEAQLKATELTFRLARIAGGTPMFLPTPGIVATSSAREALFQDPNVVETAQSWERLTDVLVGIGSVTPSPLLQVSGNAVSEAQMRTLRELGAVGDVAMRFFDADGRPIDTEFNDLVVGIGVEALLKTPRRVGIAGGARKFEAIRGALRGGWVDVIVTDLETAQALVADS
ncbi:sugar-binding transcriptional regulator [Streptosporangium amethystogenes]|uniref:sugar-binding transcriptional regulator n=1 Tax=Streptosporangium amethystogenes TaxID=2002 RepID=UPI0037915CBE